MPLELPNLDDRTYNDLVTEALSQIPSDAPDWTNYNPSDPGITLIELFAYLTELLLYRLNQVTDANLYSFLKLLNGPSWNPSKEGLAADIRLTLQQLRQHERAITCQDFENLAQAIDSRVARALCLPRCNPAIDFDAEQDGHIGIIVVPHPGMEGQLLGESGILATVAEELDKRRLLATMVHVVGPQYVEIEVEITVVPLLDVEATVLKEGKPKTETEPEVIGRIPAHLSTFLDPLSGSNDGKGWPFGRDVYVSEIYALVDRIPGVDYVTDVHLRRLPRELPDRQIVVNDLFVGLEVKPYELVKLNHLQITLQQLS